jgi:Chitobiase/beta-hexosaminidase C-terminal domain/Glycosyl hydrolases family 43
MSVPAYVQSNGVSGGPVSVPTKTLSFTSPQSAGNCNVVYVAVAPATGTAVLPASITDTSNNIYQLVSPYGAAIYNSTGSNLYAAYVAFDIAASSSNTVTITYGVNANYWTIIIVEYSGASTLGSVDGSAVSAIGTGTSLSSGSITPQGANELLITVGFATNGTTIAAGSGWTKRQTSGFADGIADQLSVSGSYTGTWTGTTGPWACLIFALAGPAVVMTPPGGLYDFPTVVSLSTKLSGASIYYTTNGAAPTIASTMYSGPFVVSAGVTNIQAFAVNSIPINSGVISYVFSINPASIVTGSSIVEVGSGLPMPIIAGHIMYDPPSGLYYWHGASFAGPGVAVCGFTGAFCYSSADLRNWTYVSTIIPPGGSTYWTRIRVIYNAANNNYVMWSNKGTSSGYQVWTAPSPSGPFTVSTSYATLDSFAASGDFDLFLDNDGVSAYMLRSCGSNSVNIGITKLSANYQNTDGTNHVYFTNNASSPFGQKSEGHAMVNVGGVYYWMTSGYTFWTPNTNMITYSTNILGSWNNGAFNPFQNVSVPQTPGEIAVGITPSYTNAYDSQTNQIINIPGRAGYFYYGDRYDVDNSGTLITSTTLNFINYKPILLPITFGTNTASITWSSSWDFKDSFPTISGAPTGASSLIFSNGNFVWTNTWASPADIYLDYSATNDFATVIRSEIVVLNGSSVSSYAPIFTPAAATGYYRIRSVNANGAGLSSTYQLPEPTPPPPPPYVPPWYLVPPQSPPYIPPSASPSSTSPSVAGYYIVYDSSGAFVIMYLIPGVDYGPNGLWFQGQIQSIYSGPYTTYHLAVIALRNVPSVFGQGPNL